MKYAYTTGTLGTAQQTIPYVYGDSNWKDKLTSCNGQTITYDAIGNPLNDGAWTFTWVAGRQLKKMVREDRTLDFKYGHNGMRVQKVLEHDWYPETTKYTYHGKLLTHMTVDYYDWDEAAQQDKLHFFYDAQYRPAKVNFNGTIYTYIHNLQGDVVGLLDNAGALVVEYKYDAWGRLLSTTGSLASTLGKRNPFRYRGYVYDEETGLYYLRSRYYSPIIGRFISKDSILIKGVLFKDNLWAYCSNSPIVYSDANGMFFVDKQGIEILEHWLAGTGETLICDSDAWAEYMRNCDETNLLACELIHDTYYECIASPDKTISKTVTQAAELSANGVSPCGYKYLHGTLTFHMTIEAMADSNGSYYFSVDCEWEDVINPNLTYKADRNWNKFAKMIATPRDYIIKVRWNLNVGNFWNKFAEYWRKQHESKTKKNSRWF